MVEICEMKQIWSGNESDIIDKNFTNFIMRVGFNIIKSPKEVKADKMPKKVGEELQEIKKRFVKCMGVSI